MKSAISAKRKNDAVITVCQNNIDGVVEIEGLNKAAERLTGYSSAELADKNLQMILPEHIKELLKSYLEYEEIGQDLASVLRKIPQFHILNKEEVEIPVSLKVFYVIASHSEKPQFELLMRDITLHKKMEEFKQQINDLQQDKNDIDAQTGLPSLTSFRTNLELIHSFVKEHSLEASLSIVKMDQSDVFEQQYSQQESTSILKHVYSLVGQSLRKGDITGYLGGGNIALALFDCNAENTKVVLNRIRMIIESKSIDVPLSKGNLSGLDISISAGFMQILPDGNVEQSIQDTKQALQKALDAGGNRIYEVHTSGE